MRRLSVAVAAMMAALAGCSGSADTTDSEKDEPTIVRIADLTDDRSVPIDAPDDLEVPDGATAEQVQWMVGQLLGAARRSVDTGDVSQRSEAEGVEWVLSSVVEQRQGAHVDFLKESFGEPGYSFAAGFRFAEDEPPVRAVHVLGYAWDAETDGGRLRVSIAVEQAVEFEAGAVVVKRTFSLASDTDTMRTDGTWAAGLGWRLRFAGLDTCAVFDEAVVRPGDLSEVSDILDEVRDREGTGLSAWAADESDDDGKDTAPDKDRAACANAT